MINDIKGLGGWRRLDRRRLVFGSAIALAASSFAGPALSAAARLAPRGSGGMSHAAWDALLARYVAPDGKGYNTVEYRRFRADAMPDLHAYVAALQGAAPSSFGRQEAHAYWINLYNAKTIEIVLDHYPVASIRDIDLGGGIFSRGPWSKKLLRVEGIELSLDDVEHEIVRPIFADPLSHYGLNCASYSCPNLAVRAYTGANVGALLAAGAAEYICHPRGVAVDGGRITASRIYDWYADDFGGRGGLKPHWLNFARPDHARDIEQASIAAFRYDWRLNEV